jgi:uncharacterized protein YebE (UPF0316 family)
MAEYLGIDPGFYSWVVLPIFIVVARIIDVTIGTLRLIFIVRGMRYISPLLGFLEVLIWLVVVTRIIKEINNPICYIAYPTGFALGNYLGIIIENKLSIGYALVRVITKKDATNLLNNLKTEGYRFTAADAISNENNAVKIIFSVLDKKYIKNYINIVKNNNPNAFYTIEEIKTVAPESEYKRNILKSNSYVKTK